MRVYLLIFLAVVALLFACGLAAVLLRPPSNDRSWEHAFSRMPVFEAADDDRFVLRDNRDFHFSADGTVTERWHDQAVNPKDLTEIWFFVEPFDGWDGAAHSFLSFVFAGETAQTLSISVEARKEDGETYSGLRGAFNAYELIYQWSTEKDILSRIAVGLDHELYAYKLALSPAQARAIFDHFAARTNQLHAHPRFYNTLTSNCTNELAKAVNNAFPNALPWHYSHILTGYSAQRLYALDFIATQDRLFPELKKTAAIGAIVRNAPEANSARFSAQWRQHLAR